MKIALIIDALKTGGAERQVLLSAAELNKLGHEAIVIIYHPYVEFNDYIRSNGIKLVQINAKGRLRIKRIRAMTEYLRQGKFDVAHAFGGNATITGSIAAKCAGTKPFFGGFRVEYRCNRSIRLAHKMVDRLLDGWIVNSKGIVDSMVKTVGINERKFFVVHNGIVPQTFCSQLSKQAAKAKFAVSQDEFTVTEIANLHHQKNHQMFLRMAGKVLQNRKDTKFLLAGDGPLKNTLQNQALSMGIAEYISFLGQRTDIADVLAATDIAVLTSNYEGFPNALIEPMCVGIPVVSTAYAGVDEVIADGDNGFVVARDNHEQMGAKVLQLLDNPELREKIGQSAKKMVSEKLSAELMAKKLLRIYQQGIDSHRKIAE